MRFQWNCRRRMAGLLGGAISVCDYAVNFCSSGWHGVARAGSIDHGEQETLRKLHKRFHCMLFLFHGRDACHERQGTVSTDLRAVSELRRWKASRGAERHRHLGRSRDFFFQAVVEKRHRVGKNADVGRKLVPGPRYWSMCVESLSEVSHGFGGQCFACILKHLLCGLEKQL